MDAFGISMKLQIFRLAKKQCRVLEEKITGNVERDLRQQNELRLLGWKVIVIWECELKKDRFNETMNSVEENILKSKF